MKKIIQSNVLAILLLLFWISFAFAQEANPLLRMEIPSSPNPVGSGARALGMGGAFIAVADDATAASWNPGALLQLDYPEVSAVFSGVHRKENNSFGESPEASGMKTIDDYNLNYLSAAYPFKINNRNMIVSLNYQHLYDFNRDWDFRLNHPDSRFVGPINYNYDQNGELYALGLAYCVKFTNDFTAGFTLNYWGDFIYENKWEQKYHQSGNIIATSPTDPVGIPGTFSSHKKEEFAFEGWNANLGFLWRISEKWTLGGVFKTPFKADIDHTITTEDISQFATAPGSNVSQVNSQKFDEKLRMPMSYGLGVAYRNVPHDNLTLSFDIFRTHWNDFEFEDASGKKTSPISGKNINESDIDSTTWFRLGAEYLIIKEKYIIPLRCGVFYDPAPAEGSPDDYYGFSLGTGFSSKRFSFDVAYQFRFGNDVGASVFEDSDFSQDVREHTVFASIIVYF
ncbi:long-chain fatty acid transport protein [Candidatus Magnetomoraceae bacterium gMMP-1]